MPQITPQADLQTVITTFEVTPGTCQDLLDELQDTFAAFISKQPGFIGAALHVNDAQTRIANYSQWRRREDFQAMLRSDEMRGHTRRFAELCKSFEPVMYEVAASYD
ncbi:antibiotic biosynthesis monooxygenase [Rhodovulum sulfidophilum]|uniref:antibiotic biosynthesis monooxygenase family protein n=1 Tax=Rhodovulum sulfidophilum TaxID=35806 RepID=UPI0005A90C06|nr:antibiotic biosynthesis monooxygenase family protein [Rhodovulum sulfidophilum]ANB33695.1 antibiotic biosynthesis monooxygenase [Rhodovulum sulfidophilum DSM 1374]ANB37516.1 antibiotic biosynthesis monooxygenase [Rhodovulum sulfidophilum]MBK5922451.1 antibiotic biosynthesis monooxygenase [Rhodovulum sulfidophilum]MBL3554082.1 antibiotic biosynthesis monooxygenase [Rhodovulum sulfidophilum]MBL3561631.1 antibiotic biosynthesis monooxygenase [Rhodovulum sulfidophilum]